MTPEEQLAIYQDEDNKDKESAKHFQPTITCNQQPSGVYTLTYEDITIPTILITKIEGKLNKEHFPNTTMHYDWFRERLAEDSYMDWLPRNNKLVKVPIPAASARVLIHTLSGRIIAFPCNRHQLDPLLAAWLTAWKHP